MKCPWCGEEVTTEEYSKHLEYCKKYPPHYAAIKERARIPSSERPELIKRLRDAVSKLPAFRIKWADVDKMSISELRETVEHVEKQLTEPLKWPPPRVEASIEISSVMLKRAEELGISMPYIGFQPLGSRTVFFRIPSAEAAREKMKELEEKGIKAKYWIEPIGPTWFDKIAHHSSNPREIKRPTMKELLKGEVLNGYLEASRVRTLEQFMPFTFLFDEGLTTEEKITVKAINKFEAVIKARDEFTKRRGTYHKTSRLVG